LRIASGERSNPPNLFEPETAAMTILKDMLKATALVRGGNLKEATDLIRARLRSGAQAPAPSAGRPMALASDAEIIERPHSTTAGRMQGDAYGLRREARFNGTVLDGLRSPLPGAPRPTLPDADIPPGASFLECSCACPQGELTYKLYVPGGYKDEPLPLLVMLHGCTQSPDDFATGTGMNAAAEERNCLVAYPAQPPSANASKCWNWFRRADQQRGAGEPAMIAAMTRQIMERYRVQPDRVYAAGLSAGGAAAAVLGATYPDIFAAIGVHSGLACGAAYDLASAMSAMRSGRPPSPAASAHPSARPIRTIVFHGDRDKIVNPVNGEFVVAQGHANAALLATRSVEGRAPGGLRYTQTIHLGAENSALSAKWVIHGAGHAWSGGSPNGSYTEPRGPDASREMLRFFLDEGKRADGQAEER
jgi:poly(hydroxyalkanoate) depolymerase family esterase